MPGLLAEPELPAIFDGLSIAAPGSLAIPEHSEQALIQPVATLKISTLDKRRIDNKLLRVF